MANRLAGILAIFAFGTVCLFGAIQGHPSNIVLGRALGALFLFYLLGRVVGHVARRVILEHFDEKLEQIEGTAEPPSTTPTAQNAQENLPQTTAEDRG